MLPGAVHLRAVNPCCGERLLYRNNWDVSVKCQSGSESTVVRAADDSALAINVDPDHAAVLHEFEAVGVAVQLGAEIVGAAHHRHDAALKLGKRHRAAFA